MLLLVLGPPVVVGVAGGFGLALLYVGWKIYLANRR